MCSLNNIPQCVFLQHGATDTSFTQIPIQQNCHDHTYTTGIGVVVSAHILRVRVEYYEYLILVTVHLLCFFLCFCFLFIVIANGWRCFSEEGERIKKTKQKSHPVPTRAGLQLNIGSRERLTRDISPAWDRITCDAGGKKSYGSSLVNNAK